MSNPLQGQVEAVRLEGPFIIKKGKNEGKTFSTHKLTVNGVELSQTDFRKEPKSPANVGDNVKVLYTTSGNGKFVNNYISELEVLDGSETPVVSKPQEKRADLQYRQVPEKPALEVTPLQRPQTVNINLVSKDTSMEVSGLLQALINSGVPQGELEAKLKAALRLKRQVALELEQNGTV